MGHGAQDLDVTDAPPAFDQHVFLRQPVLPLRRMAEEVNRQLALIRVDFNVIETMQFVILAHGLAPALAVADQASHYAMLRVMVVMTGCCVRRTTYCTSTRSSASRLTTSSFLTSMRSPSHCCKPAWMVNWSAAAISGLFGAKTICNRALPKSGRLTRSPRLVSRYCSIMSRMWSSSSVSAVRPRRSK